MIRRSVSTFAKLQKKIFDELGIRAGRFKRTYAGHWQRKQGAFVWEAITDKGTIIGSIETASELIKAKHLMIAPEEGEIFSSN